MAAARSDNLQDTLEPIFALLQKQELVESLAHRQSGTANSLVEQLVHRQHEAELRRKLHNLNAADIAHLLDMLPQKTLVSVGFSGRPTSRRVFIRIK